LGFRLAFVSNINGGGDEVVAGGVVIITGLV